MNMKVNLETSIDNLLYLDYMEKQQQITEDTKSNEDQDNHWCGRCRPQDEKEN